MPQVFQVLRCYKCSVFQVHQAKKSNKFECKICGEKQSIKRHYGTGNGQECRRHVQKLNGIRGEIDEVNKPTHVSGSSDKDKNEEVNNPDIKIIERCNQSKWSEYIETPNDTPDIDENVMYLDDKDIIELPSRKRQKNFFTKNTRHLKKPQINYSRSNYHEEDTDLDSFNDIDNNLSSTMNINNRTLLPTSINSVITESNKNKLNKISLNIDNKETHMTTSNKENEIKAKFIPPEINQNSKWATFIDNDEGKNQNESHSDTEIICFQNNSKQFFSLCDDDELDNFLDI